MGAATYGDLIVGDGSGGGGGSGQNSAFTGGAGGGSNDTLIGTYGDDVIFGDGSGGGGGGNYSGGTSNAGGLGGGGDDNIYGGLGNDILFGDGFNGSSGGTGANAFGGDGGFGGGGGGGGDMYASAGLGGLGAGDGGVGPAAGSGSTAAYKDGGSLTTTTGGNGFAAYDGGGGGGFGDIGNGGNAGFAAGSSGSSGGTSVYSVYDSDGSIYNSVLTEVNSGNIFGSTTGTTDGYGAGNDLLDGGAGSDHYFGMGGADTFVVSEQDNAGTDVDTIWDFTRGDGDKIQLENASGNLLSAAEVDTLLAGADTTGGNTTLTMGDGSQLIIKGVTDLTPADFVITCFLPGTRFETADDMKAIEELQRGDLLKTADGYAPLKWLAQRDVDWSKSIPRRVAPVLVKQGALGNGLPLRDLYVSPAHAFEIDGLLVQAELLVNGTTIVQLLDYDQDFTYYNIELDTHAIVYAEGAAVESYLEVGDNRRSYDNAAEFHALYPDHQPGKAMDIGRITLKRQLCSVAAFLAAA